MIWRMLDLFSGIGGFSLAAQWCWGDELEIVAFCEIDKFCQKILHKHWPSVPIVEDVRDVTNTTSLRRWGIQNEGWEKEGIGVEGNFPVRGRIDLLTGGFPCQPFSVAGKRKGKEDNRFLWPEMFAVIKEIRPRWVIVENVVGILSMVEWDCKVEMEGKKGFFKTASEICEREGTNILDGILDDLEREGYSVQTFIIPACAVNAPHRRDRVWIVANSEFNGVEKQRHSRVSERTTNSIRNTSQDVADSNKFGMEGDRPDWKQIKTGRCSKVQTQGNGSRYGTSSEWWNSEPDVGRVAHGVPNRVDRLKSLGNAIVPQVAMAIMEMIRKSEEES